MAHTNLSSYLAVKNRLLEIFRTEEFPNHSLPPEDQLAKRLGISLVTLREALMMLALGGVSHQAARGGELHPPQRSGPEGPGGPGLSFADAFRRSGRRPGMQMLFLGVEQADAALAERLRIREGELLQRNETLCTADGEPGVFTVSRLPAALVKRPFRLEENNWYVHECIWDHCGRKLAHSLNDYRAVGGG